ncbi:hypothetical protein FZEAL_10343 [Fusarium zealandicum]|uniref:Uncharacterized protein n=1 Tax=Fusarium zealandicum TaxID=1053134 RepID=A0A8H4U326_9HYPO|nr:hypothetical protein FZEAL_10343 [Fusarium zealandicum]
MKKPWKTTPSAGGTARPQTGQQSIRGRISGPVPISTSLDDEFPIRNPGTSIATPVQEDFEESQPDYAMTGRSHQFKSPVFPDSRRNGARTSKDEPRNSIQGRVHGTMARLQKAEPANHPRHSFVSADGVHIRDRDRPQRKQSTLRGALGKLFNRKKKPNGNDSPNNTDSETGSVPPRPDRRSTAEGSRPDLVPSLRIQAVCISTDHRV